MQRLEWSPLLETGVAEMDASHRFLLQAIHATIDADDMSLPERIAELLAALRHERAAHPYSPPPDASLRLQLARLLQEQSI